MDQSWKSKRGTKTYKVEIRHYTHTKFNSPQMQEKHQVVVVAPVHRPKLAAQAAGCPRTAKTQITGWYTTELEFYELPADKTIRNWTEWHVLTHG